MNNFHGHIYRLSTLNDGSWGNAGETDEDVIRFAEKLAEMIEGNWPGVALEVRLVDGTVSRQTECDGVLAEAIRSFVNDNYGEAIDAAEGERNALSMDSQVFGLLVNLRATGRLARFVTDTLFAVADGRDPLEVVDMPNLQIVKDSGWLNQDGTLNLTQIREVVNL